MSSGKAAFNAGEAHGTGEGKVNQTIDSAKDMASNAAQTMNEHKEKAAGFVQQTGAQMQSMAHDAAESVKNSMQSA